MRTVFLRVAGISRYNVRAILAKRTVLNKSKSTHSPAITDFVISVLELGYTFDWETLI